MHDRVRKELESILLIAVVKDPEEPWPYAGNVWLHGLLAIPDQLLAPGDAVRGHQEEDAVLSPGLGGEALRDTKCLAEKFTPLCYRLGIYPCVRVSGQRFLPKIAAETSYERLPEQVFLEIANGAEKNLRDPWRLTHHLLRALRLINDSIILIG